MRPQREKEADRGSVARDRLMAFAPSAGSTTSAAGGAVPERGHLLFLVPLLLAVAWPAAFLTEGYATSPLSVCRRLG